MSTIDPVIDERAASGLAAEQSRTGFRIRKLLIYALLIALAVAFIFPLLWVVASSVKTELDYVMRPEWLIPETIRLENYVRAWNEAQIGTFFVNSAITTSATTLLTVIVSAMAAYILGRFVFLGRSVIYIFFLAGLMLPLWLGYIPLFFLALDLGMFNNLPGYIIINSARNLAFTIFVLTPFFASLPKELEEAAVIDGANAFQVFLRVMLPLSRPGLLTVSAFNILGNWNEYDLALILLQDDSVRTIPLGIARLFTQQGFRQDFGAHFAGLVIVMLPTLLIYGIFTEKFMEGLTVGAVRH
jgi:N-acetylglucosamine transport system permease protein